MYGQAKTLHNVNTHTWQTVKKKKKKGKTVFNVLGNGSYLFLHQEVSLIILQKLWNCSAE